MRGAQDTTGVLFMLLTRDYESPTATMGKIEMDVGGLPIQTLERPWVESHPLGSPCGAKGVSRVPAGLYKLVRHHSEAHPNSVALVNPELWVYHFDGDVPPDQRGYARTTVLIHPANWVSELRGCIAPGLARDGEMVLSSRAAFNRLAVKWPETLEIVERFSPRV
jgi:hypothetical protein